MRTNRGLVKRALAAVATSTAITAAIAGFATSASGTGSAPAPTAGVDAPTTSPSTTALPAVHIDALPDSSAVPAAAPTQVVQQQISVAVVGGDMTISPSSMTLTLSRDG